MTSPGDNTRFSFGRPQWDMDRDELVASSTEVGGQVASKKDLEALLPMYGAVRVPTDGSIPSTPNRWVPFREQIGDMRGCRLTGEDSGGIVLDEIGQWQVSCRLQVASMGLAAEVEIRLETFDPDGEMVDRQQIIQTLGMLGNWPLHIDATVVVDQPGYLVRVYSMATVGAADIRHSYVQGSNILAAQYVYNGTINLGGA